MARWHVGRTANGKSLYRGGDLWGYLQEITRSAGRALADQANCENLQSIANGQPNRVIVSAENSSDETIPSFRSFPACVVKIAQTFSRARSTMMLYEPGIRSCLLCRLSLESLRE